MYIIDTYLDKDRLPVLEKKELCRETQTLNSPDMTFDFLNRYFRLKDRTEEYICQRVEPLMHRDDISRDNSRIGSIDGNPLLSKLLGKLESKQ